MQYVRSMSGAVSKTWNSINPATLSGAIDVIVVEQEDGSLACSPFHIRFGKFSLLRPSEKKVEFKVNGEKVDFPMKLGEGGEAFFVFETRGQVPESLQTSPLVSPAASPELAPSQSPAPTLQDPEPFDLENLADGHLGALGVPSVHRGSVSSVRKVRSDDGRALTEPQGSNNFATTLQAPKFERVATDGDLAAVKAEIDKSRDHSVPLDKARPASVGHSYTERSISPSPSAQEDAVARAMNLSKKLWTSNISNQVTDSGDLMLDMTGFKSSEGEALQAEVIARQLLSEEIDGPYDIGALIGADERGNIWIYSSEEAKAAAGRKAAQGLGSYNPTGFASAEALSDPGYHSDDSRSDSNIVLGEQLRRDSDSAVGMSSQPSSPEAMNRPTHGDPNKNYAKTLRLTSDQLKGMSLKSGANSMAFTVNRATCTATLWYWRHDNPIVISDIDGTITKSDVLGHVLNSLGRDWTHLGVAKLYTEISANGYNFLYLTSRSVGQADTTRAYLDGVVQEGYRLPKGPVILSPDRTIAALRREIYLRKPEIFKMACLRDIMALFSGHGGSNNTHESAEAGLHVEIEREHGLGASKGKSGSPFYAGFGNRLTDALSYRSVNIPSTRIFTINSNSEVSLDLLTLNKYKTAYSTMREIVDHYFPPVGLLVQGGGEEFTDFNYWREQPLDLVDFTDSDSEVEDFAIEQAIDRVQTNTTRGSVLSEDEAGDDMMDSFISDGRPSLDDSLANSLEIARKSLDTNHTDDDEEVEFNDADDGALDGEEDSESESVAMEDDNESIGTADFQTPALERSGMFGGDIERTPRVRAVEQGTTRVNDLSLSTR